MQKIVLLGIVVASMLVNSGALASEIKIGGGGAACNGFFYPVAEPFEEETGIILKIASTTPVQGLIELSDGRIDIAASTVPLDAMISEAAKNGVTINPS